MHITPGFILGVLVGVAIALLMAPAPGDETRDRLNERTKGVRQRVRRYWDEDD